MFRFFLIVLLPTLVLGSWLNFTISPVVQCEPITVNFSSNVAEIIVPMTLTILPLASSPVIIPIPNLALNSSGLFITFLPLQAGQNFIASLDDPIGNSLARISDLTRVLASPTGNNSCLPQDESFGTKDHFKLVSPLTQCEDISVSYKSEIDRGAPTVRAYKPNYSSYLLPQTSDNPSNGTATYTMNVQHGEQVLLAFDDGMQHRETSGLITVGGDASSAVDCLVTYPAGGNTTVAANKKTGDPDTPTSIPQDVIIGCSIGGGIILIIIIAMAIFVIRDRKRGRRKTIPSFYTQRPVQNIPPPKEGTATNPFEESPMFESGEGGNLDEGYISNPPYVMGELDSPSDGKHPQARSSFSSWAPQESATEEDMSFHRRPSVDPLAIQTLDIEGMLNMATTLSGKQEVKQADVTSDADPSQSPRRGDAQSVPLEMTGTTAQLSRVRHWHAPSDVPADLTGSGSLSAYSLLMSNPFNDNGTIVLPSPFNRADEPARPASDVVRPISKDRIGTDDAPSGTGTQVTPEYGEGKRLPEIEYREGT